MGLFLAFSRRARRRAQKNEASAKRESRATGWRLSPMQCMKDSNIQYPRLQLISDSNDNISDDLTQHELPQT